MVPAAEVDPYGCARAERTSQRGHRMTAIGEQEETALQASHRLSTRTFAMTVVSAGYGTIGLALAFPLGRRRPPGGRPSTAAPISLMSLSSAWSVSPSSRRSGRGHGVGPGSGWRRPYPLLLLLMNARISPATSSTRRHGSLLITFLTGGLAVLFGGVAAFLEVRRGRPTWTRTGRAAWTTAIVSGVLVGAAATSILAVQVRRPVLRPRVGWARWRPIRPPRECSSSTTSSSLISASR